MMLVSDFASFLELRVWARQLERAVGRLDEQQTLAFSGIQALKISLGRITPSELPNLRTLSSTMVITIVITLAQKCLAGFGGGYAAGIVGEAGDGQSAPSAI